MELAAGDLYSHQHAQHRKERPPKWTSALITPDNRFYRFYLTRASRFIKFPVGYCEGQETTCTNIRIYLVHCHVWDMVVILEEGDCPYSHFRTVTCLYLGQR